MNVRTVDLTPEAIVALPAERLAEAWSLLVAELGTAEASRRWLAAFAATDASPT